MVRGPTWKPPWASAQGGACPFPDGVDRVDGVALLRTAKGEERRRAMASYRAILSCAVLG